MTEKMNIAFIKARWHTEIVDQALVGFEKRLAGCGETTKTAIFDVPGAFDMPLPAQMLGRSGKLDAIVCAALVVDGGIYQPDFVARAVVDGLMRKQLDTGVPTFSVSLTPHHFQPTPEQVVFFRDPFVKKGEEAAGAALMLATLEA